MSVYEERPLVMEMETKQDFEDVSGYGCGCGFFRVFTSEWWRRHDEEDKHLLDERSEGIRGEDTWMMEKLKKMKETSEVMAGPKWKTFIRKISGYGRKQQRNRFQYDEHSYALNFNSGAQSEDEEYLPPSFSTRFSNPFPAPRRQNET
ncbi:uncharacterized protein LOC131632912 [Vicia villosa]|uniref:uncharacterized protein LOC131632912 n=1 Tax=Vicia villosa TaxID=3911 RepID=UPI00273BBEB5|nr:uncharacterized protein LOC131632912 [Vicia villosa]